MPRNRRHYQNFISTSDYLKVKGRSEVQVTLLQPQQARYYPTPPTHYTGFSPQEKESLTLTMSLYYAYLGIAVQFIPENWYPNLNKC